MIVSLAEMILSLAQSAFAYSRPKCQETKVPRNSRQKLRAILVHITCPLSVEVTFCQFLRCSEIETELILRIPSPAPDKMCLVVRAAESEPSVLVYVAVFGGADMRERMCALKVVVRATKFEPVNCSDIVYTDHVSLQP
jgi:hypothetical protein